ncbi:MAG: hypothetical protein JNM90_10495 [Burkholderiales bacterium]|nr:hypothetical protein [Burkholderiales bacterium]
MSTNDNDLDFTNWKPPPEPPPTTEVVPGGPQRRLIDTRKAFADAFDELLAKTGRTLRMFDRNLADFGMNSVAREEQLRSFLLKRRSNRVQIVVHDPAIVATRSPRLMRLLRQFSHAIAIHQTNEEIRNLEDVLVVGDDAHCLRRRHYAHPKGSIYLDDPVETRAWLSRFNAIWEHSAPAVSATTIGL